MGSSLILLCRVPGRVMLEYLSHSQIALPMNTYSHVAAGLAKRRPHGPDALAERDEDEADNESRAREDAADGVQLQREMQLGPATCAGENGKTPGQDGCAARDSNPEPAD